ncbi:universal stress protein [Desulfosediminicola ganghwensis]|uniref:universal stress protein n=1 Tax=Desulfosediminicola ganghwensis TaxID=2569540 RepID=UPI0010AC3102|nr:universal stress protein [Desulfosediminicola ganghwensis]
MKIENILLPFDGSTHSVNAARYALDLAKFYKAHINILHCYDEWDANLTEIPENLILEIKANRKREADKMLQKAEELFKDQGVGYSLETISGEPGHVLSNRSKSKKYDLIIMGSHGHSDIAGLFLGSVTHKVLNTIYCPVLVVP